MPNRRPQLWGLLFTFFILAFLWLPPLALYGMALWDVISHQPARLLEALPLQLLPRTLFFNTLALGGLTGLLSILLGIPVAIALARGPRPLRPLFTFLCAMPLALPPTLAASAFLEITRTPPARSLASLAASKPLSVSTVLITSFVLALCYFPVVAFPTFAALRAIPQEIEEAARLFGRSWEVWRHVLWPLLSPAIYGGAGIVCALAMWEMGAPDLLDVRTYSVQIYRDLNAPDNLDPQGKAVKAALAGLPMLALGCLALFPAARALRFYGGNNLSGEVSTGEQTFEGTALPYHKREGRAAALLATLIFIASPTAILGVFISQLQKPHILYEMWNTNEPEILNTFALASTATLGILLVSFAAATLWRGWPLWWRNVTVALAITPLLVAPVMLGVALINFWNRDQFALIYGGLPDTGYPMIDILQEYSARYAMVIIGYAARFLPLSLFLLYEAVQRTDENLLEAAYNMGATPLQAAWAVLAPLARPALLSVAALVWALCAGELTTTVLINQPGGQTLPLPIFNQMHIGATAEVAALSLILATMSGGVLLLAALILRFWESRF
ncbi:MAG: iron ABC transporter permease [Abitibacteriaceae bacterium]|nr:iron ABC transporter permease [Abditibacteriaceae bacterium]